MSTIRIDQSSINTTIANNGTLNAIRIIVAPPGSTVGHYPQGLLSLVDGAYGSVPRTLFHLDIANSHFSPASPLHSELMNNGRTEFVNLTVAHVPVGGVFDIDVTP
jgi:hypothetical protein